MIKTIKSNCFILFYELMGIIRIYPHHLAIRPTCLQIVYPHEKFIIRLPSNISAPSDTLLWRWTSVYFDPVLKFSGLFHTRRIWLVNCETLSKTNTETRNYPASCVDTREIMLAIISVFLPSPATAAWILDSADPILGGVEMNKSAKHTNPELWSWYHQDKQHQDGS